MMKIIEIFFGLYIYRQCHGIIQKKSAFGIWMLPSLVIFFQNFILI